MAPRPYVRRKLLSNCPWREREPHAASRPRSLTDAAVRHIERQIRENGYPLLPFLGIAKQLFRCGDCHAVWAASSMFEKVSENEVCGVYDHAMIWKPYKDRS
jgi:hypothetical protein